MREIDGEAPRAQAGAGLVVGHLHLHVGDVEQGLAFYRDVLGFEVMVNLGSAALVSAGGYHHHLGFNVWLGSDVKPRPPRTAGLREWTVLLATRDEIAAVRARVAAAGLEVRAAPGRLSRARPVGDRGRLPGRLSRAPHARRNDETPRPRGPRHPAYGCAISRADPTGSRRSACACCRPRRGRCR